MAWLVPTLITPAVAGCLPIPIPHTERIIPAVSADLRAPSGRPAAGVAIALTSRDDDRACTSAEVRGITDEQGHIEAPVTEQRKSVFWLTLMENFGLRWYWLCTGRMDAVGTPVYTARTVIHGQLPGDDLMCYAWHIEAEEHVTCRDRREERGRLEGGRWRAGNDSGTYRVIFEDRWSGGPRTTAYLQWLVGDSVAAVVELPGEPRLFERKRLGLLFINNRWYLTVAVRRKGFWPKYVWRRFELGPPGEFR